VPGFTHQAQRVPAYTDRVLWKSMPSLASSVAQTSLRAAGGVSTSDHKPVFAEFALRPTPVLPTLPPPLADGAPLVRVKGLRARGLTAADWNGASDPLATVRLEPAIS
jgi:hypothetical protein